MRILATFFFLSTLLFLSECVSLSSSTTLSSSASSQLKSLLESFKPSTKFGEQMMVALTMKIQSGDKVDSIESFITELSQSLEADRNSDDNISYTKNSFWNTTISQLNNEITLLNEEIAAMQLEISQMNLQYVALQNESQILTLELQLLQEKQAQLEALRQKDINAFNIRISKQNNMIMAINNIVANLTSILDSQSFISKRQVVDELLQVQKDQALVGLITLSTSFTNENITNIISLLNEVKTSLQASVDEDEAYELVAEANYNSLMAEFLNCEDSVNSTLVYITDKMASLLQSIAEDQQILNNDAAQVVTLQQQISEYQQQQSDFNALYQKRNTARNTDMSVISNALSIVQSNAGAVRGFLTQPSAADISL